MIGGIQDVAFGFHTAREYATDPTPRIPMGLPFFDHPTGGGVARGQVCMILASSGVGKTNLGLNVLRANADKPAIFFSMEMAWWMVVSRLAAMESGMSTKQQEDMYRQGLNPPGVQAAIDKYRFLLCDDRPDMKIDQMRESFYEAESTRGVKPRLILIDYMELIGGQGMMEKSQQVDRLAIKILNLARETNAAVFLLHQVKMGDSDGSEPLNLQSGKYGGHQPMNYVVGMYKPSRNRKLSKQARQPIKHDIFLQLLKNRNGDEEPDGVKHRQDPKSLLIMPDGYTPYVAAEPQQLVSVGATGLESEF